MMKRWTAAAVLALTMCGLTACLPVGPKLAGDPLPAAVELRSVPDGAQVELAATVDGVSYYVIDEGLPSMCVVHYASDKDWTAGCGGPAITVGSRGRTVAWFEDGAPSDDWSELGGGLWIKG